MRVLCTPRFAKEEVGEEGELAPRERCLLLLERWRAFLCSLSIPIVTFFLRSVRADGLEWMEGWPSRISASPRLRLVNRCYKLKNNTAAG